MQACLLYKQLFITSHEKKKCKRDMQKPGFRSKENKPDQRDSILKSCRVLF